VLSEPDRNRLSRTFAPSWAIYELLAVVVGPVWPSVVADDDVARGVALIDWGDRPPTAATSHSPAAPTVRRIASKG
jgi:hypothetical protein